MSTPVATPALAHGPTTPKPRPYRRFLTSTLHTRFVHAALVSLLLAWDNAALLGSKHDLLWWWFPLGPAGLKTLIYFIANLFIFFLQIATLKVGATTSPSPVSRVRSLVFSLDTAHTFFWYSVSAWWFSEAYIWSTSSMSWVTRGDNTRQDVLNEKPIYLRTFFLILAILHACRHLHYGHSTLHIPVSPPSSPPAESTSSDHRTHPISDRYTKLKIQLPKVVLRCGLSSLLVSGTAPFIYGLLLRQAMWKVHLSLAKPFFNLSRSNAQVTGIPPIFGTMWITICTGFILGFTWEMCSLLFVTYLIREPIKKDKPLSAASKDPNGTLLNGLKAKRDIVKTFAFWELAIIAQSNTERRKAIFTDIERPTGPMWPQMLQEALKVLKTLDERILPPTSPKAVNTEKQPSAEPLPKLVSEVKGGNIFASPPPNSSTRTKLNSFVTGEIRKIGSSPEPWRPQLDQAVKLIEHTKAAEIPGSVTTEIKQSPAAWLFTSTNAAKVNASILGSPHGNAALVIDAIESVTRMLISSLQEDLYGNTIKGVPSAVKQFTTSISLIEAFIRTNPPGSGKISEVDAILARLKAGLRELLGAFHMYLTDTALGIGELNAARDASGEKSIEAQKQKQNQKAPLELADAPPATLDNGRDRAEDTWRSWGRQTSSKDAPLQHPTSGEAPARLFVREDPQKKTSRTVHVPRRREMEQVR